MTRLHYQAVWTATQARTIENHTNSKRGWGSPLFQGPANKEIDQEPLRVHIL